MRSELVFIKELSSEEERREVSVAQHESVKRSSNTTTNKKKLLSVSGMRKAFHQPPVQKTNTSKSLFIYFGEPINAIFKIKNIFMNL